MKSRSAHKMCMHPSQCDAMPRPELCSLHLSRHIASVQVTHRLYNILSFMHPGSQIINTYSNHVDKIELRYTYFVKFVTYLTYLSYCCLVEPILWPRPWRPKTVKKQIKKTCNVLISHNLTFT